MALSPKQQRFIAEYMVDLNATAAYKRADYRPRNDNVAAVEAHRLLRNPKIAAAIAAAQQARAQRTEIEADRVLREIARIAFLDPAQLYDADGRLLPIRCMPLDARLALAALEEEAQFDQVATGEVGPRGGEKKERVQVGVLRKIKFWSKVEALDRLCRHLGLFKPDALDLNVKGELTVTIEDQAAADAKLEEWERAHQPAKS